jgi:O-glycosyl hydrolase
MGKTALICLGLGLASHGQTAVSIDPTLTRQAFEGWGTSLCWWAHGVGRWSDANLDPLIGRITDPDTGLGYSIFRYNIGGGDQPAHAHFRQYGDVPGYKPTESGPYDWTADAYQRKVAGKLAARARDAVWEAFSNSPPWWMTKSGCTGGNSDGSDNLKTEYFDDFAEYQTEVVKHFRDAWGISFRTVTPFNEPSARWWTGQNKNQEGCGFRDNQPRMVKILGQSLKAKGLMGTGISAPDENSIADAVARLSAYDDSALAVVTQFNAHSYNGKDHRQDFAALAGRLAKKSWQSESGPLVWPGGNQMDVSLWMADVIIKDLRDMKVNAWLDWQILDGGVWGSFSPNYSQQRATPNKRFYMHAQFSRFIRPGSRILASDGDNTLAALVPSTGNLVVVILNAQVAPADYTLDVSKFAALPPAAAFYRTSATEDAKKLPDIPVRNGGLVLVAAGKSINTLVLRVGVPNTGAVPRIRTAEGAADSRFRFEAGGMVSGGPMHGLPVEGVDAVGRRIPAVQATAP